MNHATGICRCNKHNMSAEAPTLKQTCLRHQTNNLITPVLNRIRIYYKEGEKRTLAWLNSLHSITEILLNNNAIEKKNMYVLLCFICE